MKKLASDNIIGAGDPIAVREQQDMTEHDRSEVPADMEKQDLTMIKPRAEIIREFRNFTTECPHAGLKRSYQCEECLVDLLARRDAMVIEFISSQLQPELGPEFIRALRRKLK